MIVLDTSVLVGALTGLRRAAAALRTTTEAGESAAPFGTAEAQLNARLYRAVPRARGREIDLAIAATALVRHSCLRTLSPADFSDIFGIRLWRTP